MNSPRKASGLGGIPVPAPEADTSQNRRERLETLGLLSTRVAHDLNNMLAPMQMAVPVLRESMTDASARSLLDTVEATVARATALVRQVLEYSQTGGGGFQLILMQQLIQEVAAFAADTFPRNIHVEDSIPAHLWATEVNLSQIHQVLLNLCVNSREAMGDGGTLRLAAENCALTPTDAARIAGARAGTFVVLTVEDTGPGFPPRVLDRLWEPYVTTKPVGTGSGLGLSTVREIVARHAGFVTLRSAPGQGATFRIYLPAAGIAAAEPPKASGAAKSPARA